MLLIFSPDITVCGWLGSKHLTSVDLNLFKSTIYIYKLTTYRSQQHLKPIKGISWVTQYDIVAEYNSWQDKSTKYSHMYSDSHWYILFTPTDLAVDKGSNIFVCLFYSRLR